MPTKLPPPKPRPCKHCGETFMPPKPKKWRQQYCSLACQWEAFRRPTELNGELSRATADQRGATQRGRYNGGKIGATYTKRNGKHEHVRIAEAKIGRPLLPNEVAHHIDENKKNNDPSNIIVMTKSEHSRMHTLQYYQRRREAAVLNGGEANASKQT